MSSSSEFRQTFRRLKPEKRRTRLSYRKHADLLFVSDLKPPFPPFLLDTTVYIDALQGRLPPAMEAILRGGVIWHSPVTESEIAAAVGLLDPSDPRTAKTIAQLVLLIEKRAVHRVLSPDQAIWRDAGLTSGILARLQNYSKEDRRKALNDALLFFTALKHGCSVLTRNIKEFDLFQQLNEAGRVVFYERLP